MWLFSGSLCFSDGIMGIWSSLIYLDIIEYIRENKIQEREEFAQIILQRGSGQQQSVFTFVLFELPDQPTAHVLKPVPLIHTQIFPSRY